ncbi:unnamed protein product [Ambrosiozyma monospora]|uniref:Unnamed protein product n=1 Tax=Ambrosiozyma monospora TaxID=43982 RepID=A0A9W7DFM3_AMBMO|nr:unnamed protein product [Ambrosiozyma monospora]
MMNTQNSKKQKSKTTKNPKNADKKQQPMANSLKKMEIKKRQVYKPILSNPYTKTSNWPLISPEVLQDIVKLLTENVFRQVQIYNMTKGSSKSSQKSSNDTTPEQSESQQQQEQPTIPRPTEHQHYQTGFNTIMKTLECQIKLIQSRKFNPEDPQALKYLFICKNDMTSPLLYNHFPIMTQLAHVKLIQLPKTTNKKLKVAIFGEEESGTIEVLGLLNGFVLEYPVLKHVIEENVDFVDVDFVGDKLGLQVKFLLTDQPVGGKNKQGVKK